MRQRTKSRVIVTHILYQKEISNLPIKTLIKNYSLANKYPDEVVSFARELLQGIEENISYLDTLINKYAQNWEVKRMAIIDRNILRLGIYEILFRDDIPPKVSINEAVELAKMFGDIDSPRFINGILDKVYKIELSKSILPNEES